MHVDWESNHSLSWLSFTHILLHKIKKGDPHQSDPGTEGGEGFAVNIQRGCRTEQGLFGGKTPAPSLWTKDESLTPNIGASKKEKKNRTLSFCPWGVHGVKSEPDSLVLHAFCHISHYGLPCEKWSLNLCAFLQCDEACTVSQLCPCVQLVGEMFLWISA